MEMDTTNIVMLINDFLIKLTLKTVSYTHLTLPTILLV